jgi:hypothetical protein
MLRFLLSIAPDAGSVEHVLCADPPLHPFADLVKHLTHSTHTLVPRLDEPITVIQVHVFHDIHPADLADQRCIVTAACKNKTTI